MFHVKQHLLLHDLVQFLKTQNIHLNTTQVRQLNTYHSMLISSTNRMNLISSGDKQFILERHFLTSFYYLYYLMQESKALNKRILDLGTGAGLPGIILGIALRDAKITLIDSSRKKTLFLKNLITKLDLDTEIICERIENFNIAPFRKFDIILARAVASIPALYNWCGPLLNRDGYLLTLKGDNYKEELNTKLNIKLKELIPNPSWCDFSNYLINKRMIKILNN